MPQLDNNTFLTQYVNLIVVLISVYLILAYLVLPILLRSTAIRNKFLAITGNNFDFLLINEYKNTLTSHTFTDRIQNSYNSLTSHLKSAVIALYTVFATSTGSTKDINSTGFTHISNESYIIYLALLSTIEDIYDSNNVTAE